MDGKSNKNQNVQRNKMAAISFQKKGKIGEIRVSCILNENVFYNLSTTRPNRLALYLLRGLLRSSIWIIIKIKYAASQRRRMISFLHFHETIRNFDREKDPFSLDANEAVLLIEVKQRWRNLFMQIYEMGNEANLHRLTKKQTFKFFEMIFKFNNIQLGSPYYSCMSLGIGIIASRKAENVLGKLNIKNGGEVNKMKG